MNALFWWLLPKVSPKVTATCAWVTENQLVLGQRKVDDKSNEITANPKLLKLLEVKVCIVMVDAIGYHQPDSLADFLKDARGVELPAPESLDPDELHAPRGTTTALRAVVAIFERASDHPIARIVCENLSDPYPQLMIFLGRGASMTITGGLY